MGTKPVAYLTCNGYLVSILACVFIGCIAFSVLEEAPHQWVQSHLCAPAEELMLCGPSASVPWDI